MSRVILPAAQRYARMAAATPSNAPKGMEEIARHTRLVSPAAAKALGEPAKETSVREAAELSQRTWALEMAARQRDLNA